MMADGAGTWTLFTGSKTLFLMVTDGTIRKIYKAKPGDYPAYAEMYMTLLPDDGNILFHLQNNYQKAKEIIESLPEAKLAYRYAPGKWTIKEILVHIIDDERIFSCRALQFARNEKANLVGFDQDRYTVEWDANNRTLQSIFEEYESVRKATITLFTYLPIYLNLPWTGWGMVPALLIMQHPEP